MSKRETDRNNTSYNVKEFDMSNVQTQRMANVKYYPQLFNFLMRKMCN